MVTQHKLLAFSPANMPRPAAQKSSLCEPLLAGGSAAAMRLRAQIRRVAPHFRTVLFTGEPHCADAAVARALHRCSPAHNLPLYIVSSDEAEQRILSLLSDPKPPEGMLYLPEVAKISRAAQIGLLRLLRGKSGNRIPLWVAAFAGNGLRPHVSVGGFSPDLAGALESLRLTLPPLRERAEDIPLLLTQMFRNESEQPGRTAPQFSTEFLQAASRYSWPGNLERMQAMVRWLLEHSSHDRLLRERDFNTALENMSHITAPPGPRLVKLEQVVQEHIRSVLLACDGNKLRAAEVLGISRSTLYRMLGTTGFENDWQMAG